MQKKPETGQHIKNILTVYRLLRPQHMLVVLIRYVEGFRSNEVGERNLSCIYLHAGRRPKAHVTITLHTMGAPSHPISRTLV